MVLSQVRAFSRDAAFSGPLTRSFRLGVVRVAPTSGPCQDASSATTDGQRVRAPSDDLTNSSLTFVDCSVGTS